MLFGHRRTPIAGVHGRTLIAAAGLLFVLGTVAPATQAMAASAAPTHYRVVLLSRGPITTGNHRRLWFAVRGLKGARTPVQVRLTMPAMNMYQPLLYARTLKNGYFHVITPVAMAGRWVARVHVGKAGAGQTAGIPFRAVPPPVPLTRRLLAAAAALVVLALGSLTLRLMRRSGAAKATTRTP